MGLRVSTLISVPWGHSTGTPCKEAHDLQLRREGEYLAFMRGTVVMTVSGLALWFANLTLQ